MRVINVTGRSFPNVYHRALEEIACEGNLVETEYKMSGLTHTLEVAANLVVYSPLAEPRLSLLSNAPDQMCMQYLLESMCGILDFRIGNGHDYSYHSRFIQQVWDVVQELKRFPASRRAVIDLRDWQTDLYSSSPACAQHIQYMIRDGEIDCFVLFRSNDLINAFPLNFNFFIVPWLEAIAEELGYKVGSIVYRVNSLHVYERDIPILHNYIRRLKKYDDFNNSMFYILPNANGITFFDRMTDTMPEVQKTIFDLKKKEKEV